VVGRRLLVGGAAGALAAVCIAGGGCAAAAGDAPAAAPTARAPKPALARFASCEGFLRHVRRRTIGMVGAYGLDPALPLGAVPAPGALRDGAAAPATGGARPGVDFSGTNVQEAGVDEPDLVETDGRTIFSIAEGRVQATDVTGAAPRHLGSIGFDDMSATGLLLDGDRLLVIGDTGPRVIGGVPLAIADTARIAPFPSQPATVLVLVDVSDPATPRVLSRMRVDGSLVAARRTGTSVRVVVSSSPAGLPLVQPSSSGAGAVRAATRANRRAVARASASAWLPRITVRDVASGRTVRRAVGCRSVSRPAQFAGVGMVSVLTVGATDKLSLLDTDAILTDGDLVYASPTALYVATPRWAGPVVAESSSPPRGATLIHKLDTSDPARTVYRASGAVRGYLLNQFSMSEYQGDLRVASTEEPDWWTPPGGGARPSESVVTVLAERDGRLAQVGQVDGLARGERTYAVRFLGPRGYVVTFRQIDPLFTLDLSDPAHPAVRGELKMPGFSSYLHPIDENTLIGVGQAADDQGRTQGTQVSLFDVSDLSAPRLIAQRTLDTAWSEAESDHHAFLWWPARNLLVLPVQSYGQSGATTFLGAVGLDVTRATGITPIARVHHPDDPDMSWSPVHRSVVVGDALYTVSDTGVLGSALDTLAPRGWAAFR
jgi:uncharacterized secreted protein with C-terminal beta-propeller domain